MVVWVSALQFNVLSKKIMKIKSWIMKIKENLQKCCFKHYISIFRLYMIIQDILTQNWYNYVMCWHSFFVMKCNKCIIPKFSVILSLFSSFFVYVISWAYVCYMHSKHKILSQYIMQFCLYNIFYYVHWLKRSYHWIMCKLIH